ncbi:hypothetical protein KC19_3G037800 [Ceratodon purpureus]|uniref:RING-type E3 ubiquitin transferase n=1 Tax=Ceratodon purpureus TaxID=3225 RepID=A0A8T0IGW2_CERPU|nr:hypothetical protein KC19_3G037800 [Ceratodon purpureus]
MKRKFEFDEEILECPLCNDLLFPPIHQCENGHMGCKACCEKLKEKECPTCRAMPFAHSRCLGFEKIVESLRTTCLYAGEGCTEMIKYSERDKHAAYACEYRQLRCPVPTCCFQGSKSVVPEHFKNEHNAVIARCPRGIRSKKIFISWPRRSARYILIDVDKELFLVRIHYVSEVLLPVEQLDDQHAGLIMFCCSSFGNEQISNIQITVKSTEGLVSSTSTLKNVLAFNNQAFVSTSEDWNLILLPNVNLRPDDLEFSLGLTIL